MNQKISISLDEDLIKLIDAERGDTPRSKFIENTLKSAGSLFQILWIFSDEFESVSNAERWLSAHTSQPIGKPLHKHEGFLSISENSLRFYNNDMDLVFSIERGSIKELEVTYDETFKRFRDSRGFMPPLKIVLESNAIYLFTKTIGKKKLRGDRMFRGSNETIEAWYKRSELT